MNVCPNCRTRVPEDALICDACNHILDASFLGSDITNAPDEKPAIEPPRAPAATITARPDEREASMLAAATADSAQALEDVARQFQALARVEQLTAGGAGLVLLSLALPWRSTPDDGEMIGLLGGAAHVGFFALLTGASVFARRHPKLRPWRDWVLMGATATAVLCALACLAYLSTASVEETVRAGGRVVTRALSTPQLGVFVGLLGALATSTGAIASFLQRDRLE